MVERMFSAGHRAMHDPLVDTLRQVFIRTDPVGYAASLAVLRDADLRTQLPDIDIPVLVVTGRQDPLIPPAAARTLIEGLPRASHLELDTGHFPPVEAPRAFAEAVEAFLSRSMAT